VRLVKLAETAEIDAAAAIERDKRCNSGWNSSDLGDEEG